jgi:hypothetical protein
MKRRIVWIGGGSLAALVLAVGALALVAWLRAPTIPSFVTQDFAYYTTHFTDPRVRGCLSPAERLELRQSRALERKLMREIRLHRHFKLRGTGTGRFTILDSVQSTSQGFKLGSWANTPFVTEVACMKQHLRR